MTCIFTILVLYIPLCTLIAPLGTISNLLEEFPLTFVILGMCYYSILSVLTYLKRDLYNQHVSKIFFMVWYSELTFSWYFKKECSIGNALQDTGIGNFSLSRSPGVHEIRTTSEKNGTSGNYKAFVQQRKLLVN